MSTIKNSNKKNKDIPQNKKVAKPWGSEYSIYRNKISSAKLLKLNTNQKRLCIAILLKKLVLYYQMVKQMSKLDFMRKKK